MPQAPLAHLRFPLEQARGRRYPEFPHPYRSEFQRDRDRIVHARAFRRLEDKTQVFGAGVSDHFRNRLTHTIEVSQIARTVAAACGLDEDFTEALALAHDIGHPPLAHAGEEELDRLMRRFGARFDHNLHALRIVESFEHPYARFPGLNLTFEVREGIGKHSRDFEPGEIPELDEYLPGLKPPLEAQLIDLCDEVAYNAADLDDGYNAGLISTEDACDSIPKFRELAENTEIQYPGAAESVRMQEIVRGLINWMVSGLIEGTVQGAEQCPNLDAVRKHPSRIVRFSPETAEGTRQIKAFLRSRVYQSNELVASRNESTGRITALFEFFLANPDRLPSNYREEMGVEPLHRQICDYVAGMTDGFLRRVCSQLGLL